MEMEQNIQGKLLDKDEHDVQLHENEACSFPVIEQGTRNITTTPTNNDSYDTSTSLIASVDEFLQLDDRYHSSSTRDAADSKEDDESVFQCHSLDYDEPTWERSLFRLSTTAMNHRTTVVHHPPPRKMFLAHTESRDCAYDVGDNEIDDFSLDTNHSDFFIQSLPSKQRLSFNQRQNSHIYRSCLSKDSILNLGTYDEQYNNIRRQEPQQNQQSLNEIPSSLSRGRTLHSMMRTTTTATATTVSTNVTHQYSVRSSNSTNLLQIKDSGSTLELQSSSFTSYAPLCKAVAFDGGGVGDVYPTTSSEDNDESDDEWEYHSHTTSSDLVVDDDDDGVDEGTAIASCWNFTPLIKDYEIRTGCNNREIP